MISTWRTTLLLWTLFFLIGSTAQAGILHSNRVLLLCHRTANRDLPENTLESLALAARMGCDIVEVDVRRTADGVLVLNHDGFLDRFTDTTGEVEDTDVGELNEMDFGVWMGEPFRGMRIAHFDDALRMARDLRIGLYLDIKNKGIGKQVLAALAREGMTSQVVFGGEWDDIRLLDPRSNDDQSAGVQPGFTRADVQALQKQNKIVIANFILNGHEFDLDGMKQAVAFGVNGIMVDYPRLGAEAVGRPVENKIAELAESAESGSSEQRVQAIRELSGFVGFPLQSLFVDWLLTGDELVSHEAALALVTSIPQPAVSLFGPATHSSSVAARSNAAWAIGALARRTLTDSPCASLLAPMLHDASIEVLKQALVGLSRCPSDPQNVPAQPVETLLTGSTPVLRGLAAVALAKHHPDIAERVVPPQLEEEEKLSDTSNAEWTARGRPKLSKLEIENAVAIYRAQMKELQALNLLPEPIARRSLTEQAFRPGHDYSMMPILVSGFQMWNRLAEDPTPALEALSSQDSGEADWAEWSLVKAGPDILPAIRHLLLPSHGDLRRRILEVLAWQADTGALPLLHAMEKTEDRDRESIRWAITKIQALCIGKSPAD
jgi:glycerophosphoryl diester phosphodiesterase